MGKSLHHIESFLPRPLTIHCSVVLLIHEHFETLFSRIGVSRFITISADTKENMRFFNELDLALRRDTVRA